MRVHGVSMHYYNERANSDKFYRAMYWKDGNGQWFVGFHWGRDGAAGQGKLQRAWSQAHARAMVDAKVKEQTSPKKNYQHLGEGFVDIPGNGGTVEEFGLYLHSKVGRPPLKLPGGMDYLIHEEDDLDDLLKELACLSG